jgi:hypothetical protein
MICTLEEFKAELPSFIDNLLQNAEQWEDWENHAAAESLVNAGISLEEFCKTAETFGQVITHMEETSFTWYTGEPSHLISCWIPGLRPPLCKVV